MAGVIVKPLSLKDIRRFVKRIRTLLGLKPNESVDIVKIYEYVLQDLGVNFEIVSKEEMGTKHGETLIGKNTIRIREDVYEKACAGYGRDRLTLAHELGHLFLHRIEDMGLARNENSEVAPWCDPEWQANAFAGELLAPYEYVKEMTIEDIVHTYNITYDAANVQKYRRKNGGQHEYNKKTTA